MSARYATYEIKFMNYAVCHQGDTACDALETAIENGDIFLLFGKETAEISVTNLSTNVTMKFKVEQR